MMQANYKKVALWSAEKARSDYLGLVQVSNPQSPLALYPRTTIVETRVKSVSPLGRGGALVGFAPGRGGRGGRPPPPATRGGGAPPPLRGGADEARGPVREPAGLPGAALPPRRRD